MRLCPAVLRLALPLLAARLFADVPGAYEVYLAAGADKEALSPALDAILPANAPCRYTELAPACHTMTEAKRQARALEAGVSQLPSLVVSDTAGNRTALPLAGLTREQADAARTAPQTPERMQAARQRQFQAALFLLGARFSLEPLNDSELDAATRKSRQLLLHSSATEEQRQFIALRLLYPLLMLQYSRAYNGAHTPESEALLLEAIAALETARDANPVSTLGRQAHAERERLRAARLKSRQYE